MKTQSEPAHVIRPCAYATTSQKCAAVPRRARISGSETFVSLNSRLESNKEEEEVPLEMAQGWRDHSPRKLQKVAELTFGWRDNLDVHILRFVGRAPQLCGFGVGVLEIRVLLLLYYAQASQA